MTDLPVELKLPTPQPDLDRDAAMRAAVFYDRAQAEREEMRDLLEQAKMACQIKDNKIDSLKLELETERNRYDSLHNAYNEALQDRADLEAILSTQQAHHEDQAARLAKFEFSRVRRKRANGKRSHGESMPDNAGSEAALAEIGSLVASGSGQ